MSKSTESTRVKTLQIKVKKARKKFLSTTYKQPKAQTIAYFELTELEKKLKIEQRMLDLRTQAE